MKVEKKLEIPIRVHVDDYPSEKVVALEFEDVDIRLWVIGLCMLKEEVIKRTAS